jgi:hypothetical protein
VKPGLEQGFVHHPARSVIRRKLAEAGGYAVLRLRLGKGGPVDLLGHFIDLIAIVRENSFSKEIMEISDGYIIGGFSMAGRYSKDANKP